MPDFESRESRTPSITRRLLPGWWPLVTAQPGKMDHDTNDRYTQFPDLKYGVEPVPKTATVPWTWVASDPNINTLILSWAAVLGSLTGEDTPVFSVDNEPISASRAAGGYRKAILDKSCRECAGFTGIFTNEVNTAPYS